MRFAVDARDLVSDTRGIGRYTRAILRRLVAYDDFALTLLTKSAFSLAHRKRFARAIGSDHFSVAARARNVDVIWHPANGTFFDAAAPAVATIHDAVPFRFPAHDPKQRERQQAPFLRSARHASRVVAVSHFGRSEIHQVLGVPLERIDVVYHGVEPFFSPGNADDLLPAPLRGRPYFLFVGDPTAEPRKNFAVLCAAYRGAFGSRNGPALAVVGAHSPLPSDVIDAGVAGADMFGEGDAFLWALYRRAVALCIPSYYETFGMPMIEAMACGTPVLAARSSCLPEVGGDAALYVDPHDAGAWSEALQRIASDATLRHDRAAAGRGQARRYDWDLSAQQHAAIFRSAYAT